MPASPDPGRAEFGTRRFIPIDLAKRVGMLCVLAMLAFVRSLIVFPRVICLAVAHTRQAMK